MLINTRFIKFKGMAEIPADLDRLKNIVVGGEFSLEKYEEKPNEDSTCDAIYSAIPIRVAIQDGGNKVILKIKSKDSQRLKQAIWNEFVKRSPGGDDEAYYHLVMDRVIANLEPIIDTYIK